MDKPAKTDWQGGIEYCGHSMNTTQLTAPTFHSSSIVRSHILLATVLCQNSRGGALTAEHSPVNTFAKQWFGKASRISHQQYSTGGQTLFMPPRDRKSVV